MCARVIVIWLIPHQIALWVCSLIYSAMQFNHNTLISKCNTTIIIMAISVDIIMDGGKCIVDNTLIPMHFYQRCWRKYPQNTNVHAVLWGPITNYIATIYTFSPLTTNTISTTWMDWIHTSLTMYNLLFRIKIR